MQKRIWPFILLGFFLLFLSIGAGMYFFIQNKTPEQIFNYPIIKNTILNRVGSERKELVDLLPQFLGFHEPKTYLILFENNTEIRPGGGFIGTYATVKVTQGKVDVLAVEGTEVLDKRTPATWKPQPPKMIQEKLGLDRWYFRDSNWSPDYPTDVQKALEFYAAEGGVNAKEIDGVIAFTPAVLEKLLEITGPLTIEGVTFNSENVVVTLEHEVEYGFEKKGIDFIDRKKIIQPFFHELLKKIGPDAVIHTQKYVDLFEGLAREKQVLVYFKDETIQNIMKKRGWTGEVKSTDQDYLLWVDANLGALKTDAKIKRELSYSVDSKGVNGSVNWVGSARMKYIHTGVFDKFTSRYRTYARVYVPEGSELIEVTSIDKNGKAKKITTVDQGRELGKQWFGVYFVVEPQEIGELNFLYMLPDRIRLQGEQGKYHLLTQKQSSLENIALTLKLNFDTTIQTAKPAEDKKNWGDTFYSYSSDFREDKEFSIGF